MPTYLKPIPVPAQADVAALSATVVDHAAALGDGRWGVTPYVDGIRINVGWTEILTALPKHLRLIVDGNLARSVKLPRSVALFEGKDDRGFYPTVPGSVLAEIPYRPIEGFRAATKLLLPSLMKAVGLAGRRRAGRGIKEGHRQQVVNELGELLGRTLPAPNFGGPSSPKAEDGADLMEGALRRALSSDYERNPAARAQCLEHHGSACIVCGFSFEAIYGPLGRGFIHVHHVVPVSSRGGRYAVSPIEDLVPVCPNCHAMLHRIEPPLSIQALRDLIARP